MPVAGSWSLVTSRTVLLTLLNPFGSWFETFPLESCPKQSIHVTYLHGWPISLLFSSKTPAPCRCQPLLLLPARRGRPLPKGSQAPEPNYEENRVRILGLWGVHDFALRPVRNRVGIGAQGSRVYGPGLARRLGHALTGRLVACWIEGNGSWGFGHTCHQEEHVTGCPVACWLA